MNAVSQLLLSLLPEAAPGDIPAERYHDYFGFLLELVTNGALTDGPALLERSIRIIMERPIVEFDGSKCDEVCLLSQRSGTEVGLVLRYHRRCCVDISTSLVF